MAILELVNSADTFDCTLLIFSGRNNPVFTIESPSSVAKLKGLFAAVTQEEETSGIQPVLGYNGIKLQLGNTSIEVFKEKMTVTLGSGEQRTYQDDNRRIELYLLQQAKEHLPEFSAIIDTGI